MNANALSQRCPICRGGEHDGAGCTGEIPVSIVLLTIDERTSPHVMANVEAAIAAVERLAKRRSARRLDM